MSDLRRDLLASIVQTSLLTGTPHLVRAGVLPDCVETTCEKHARVRALWHTWTALVAFRVADDVLPILEQTARRGDGVVPGLDDEAAAVRAERAAGVDRRCPSCHEYGCPGAVPGRRCRNEVEEAR